MFTFISRDRTLVQNLQLVINAVFVKTKYNYTRHLEFSARTITSAFTGDTQLVDDCVSYSNGGTVKDTGSKCVAPIFQRKSGDIFSNFKWVSFSTAVNHHALHPWRIDPFDSNRACGTLEHSYSLMVSSRFTSFPTSFYWRRRISMTTSFISCHFCFCGTVGCYLECSSSNM